MDALKTTLEGLKKVQMIQQLKKKRIATIRQMTTIKHGLYQIAITDEDRKEKILQEINKSNIECSKVYEDINQERTKAGLPAMINPYKN